MLRTTAIPHQKWIPAFAGKTYIGLMGNDMAAGRRLTGFLALLFVSSCLFAANTEPQNNKNNLDLNAITLTRFAIQSLYSPERLLVVPAGVSRTPMQTRRNIHLMYGASISARPLISWHGGDFYITAVELDNQLKQEIILDPRQMPGNWQTATFYPTNTLAGRDSNQHTTTVFLVSDRPFNDALQDAREFIR